MKDFLIGMGIGFVVGACLVKSSKELSKAVDKTKQVVEDTIDMGKEKIEEATKPKKQTSNKK